MDDRDLEKIVREYRYRRRPLRCRLGFHVWSQGPELGKWCSICGERWHARRS